MNKRAYSFAIAIGLAATGFLVAVGLMSVLFTAHTSSFSPKSSADAAGWVQAIGSIVAILASYHLGGRQAAAAQRQADELAQEKKSRQQSIDQLVVQAINNAKLAVAWLTERPTGDQDWQYHLPYVVDSIQAALGTLRTIPVVELIPVTKSSYVTDMVAVVTHILHAVNSCQSKLDKITSYTGIRTASKESEVVNAHNVLQDQIHAYLKALERITQVFQQATPFPAEK